MRKIIGFVFVLIFSACGSRDRDLSGVPAVRAEKVDPMKVDTVLPFSGVWMEEGYITNIRRTRSTVEAEKFASVCYYFPARTLQDVKTIWGFHEGGAQTTLVRDGDRWRMVVKDVMDTTMPIMQVSANELRIGDQKFLRMAHGDTALYDWGIVEETIFEGRYRDSAGRKVEFLAHGRVEGLDSFRMYEPYVDYTGDPQPVDHLELYGPARGKRDFGFRFTGDSLLLCRIKCEDKDTSGECAFEALGEPVFSLVREKK